MKCFILIILLAISSLRASNQEEISADDFYIDFTIPDLSAFSLLNTKPISPSAPGYLKEFAFEVANQSIDADMVPPGVAIQWAPLYKIGDFNYKDMSGYKLRRLLQSIQITAGTLKEKNITNLATGIKIIILDESDPMLNPTFRDSMPGLLMAAYNPYVQSEKVNFLNKEVQPYVESLKRSYPEKADLIERILLTDLPTDAKTVDDGLFEKIKGTLIRLVNTRFNEQTEHLEKLETLVKSYIKLINYANRETNRFDFQDSVRKLRTKFEQDNWNKLGLSLAAGSIFSTDDHSWENLKFNRLSWVVNFMLPSTLFWRNTNGFGAALIAYAQNNIYSEPGPEKQRYDFSFGSSLLLGKSQNRFSVDYLYSYFNRIDMPNESGTKISIGYEFKVQDGVWLELILGIDKNSYAPKSKIVTCTNFKYALGSKPRF
jgi:hypothetical protein